MKLAIYILSFVLCCSSFAQKKKDLKKHKIRCISATETEGGKTINDSKEFYNAEGELITETNFDKDGNLKSITQYKYINGNDLSEEIKYDNHNIVTEKKTYTYNSLGEKTGEILKDKDDHIVKKMEYLYNDKGLKSERRTYDAANKLISVKKYNYNCK